MHAYDGITGQDVAGFPKVTGGWLFAPPELSRDGRMAAISREGFLFEWNVPAFACQPEWPTFRHDPHSTGNYDADGTPPGSVRGLSAARDGQNVSLSWLVPGDDGLCDQATARRYRVQVNGVVDDSIAAPQPAVAGTEQSLLLADSGAAIRTVSIQAIDERGNAGFPRQIGLAGAGDGNGGGNNGGGNPGGGDNGNGSGGNTGGAGSGGVVNIPGNGSGGGCTLTNNATAFDPLLLLLLALSRLAVGNRRRQPGRVSGFN